MPAIYLSPGGQLYIEREDLGRYPALSTAFSKGSGHGLLFLDGSSDAFTEEAVFAFWKDFARAYLSLFAAEPNLESHDFSKANLHIDIPDEDLDRFLLSAPPMKGLEYLNKECLSGLCEKIETALREEIRESGKTIAAFFSLRHSNVSLLGRICFHLAENKNSGKPLLLFWQLTRIR